MNDQDDQQQQQPRVGSTLVDMESARGGMEGGRGRGLVMARGAPVRRAVALCLLGCTGGLHCTAIGRGGGAQKSTVHTARLQCSVGWAVCAFLPMTCLQLGHAS